MARIRLLGDATRSIADVLRYTIEEYGETGVERYAALIGQAISDFGADPSSQAIRPIGKRGGRSLLRYDLVSSKQNVPSGIGRVARPRHFLVGRLDGDMLRILFIAHDGMSPENVLRRSPRSDARDD